MGTYLGRPGPPSGPAQVRADLPERPVTRRPAQPLRPVHRVQHVHRAHPEPRHRPAPRPPNWDPAQPAARRCSEAWRRFPMRRPATSILGPQPADWWESYLKRSIWSLRHPRAVWSPVTVRIAPPEPHGPPPAPPAEVITLAGSAAAEKTPSPDPCAKEAVLTALRESQPGRVWLVEPLFAENVDPQSPAPRPSAFRAPRRSGDPRSYTPRPGPLQRGCRPRCSGRALCRRPSRSSISSAASRSPLGPIRGPRNAISSSYSSGKEASEPQKTSASPLAPEWPVKRPEKGRGGHSPVPLASDLPVGDSGGSWLPTPKAPPLPCNPGGAATAAAVSPLSKAFPAGDPTGEERAGPQLSHQAQEVTAQTTTDGGPEKPRPLPHTLLCVETMPALTAQPTTLESLQEGQQPPDTPLCPPAPAGGITVTQSPPEAPSPLTPPAAAEPKAALVLLTPVSAASLATDALRPPATPEADGSAQPQGSLGDAPGPPTRELLGAPSHPTPPAATSADPGTTAISGLPPGSEPRGRPSPGVSPTQSSPTYTFKPIFGAVGPLQAGSVGTPLSLGQSSPSVPPATPHPVQGLVTASSAAGIPSPADASQAGASQSPLDPGRVIVTRAVSCSVATGPLRATQVVSTSLSCTGGLVFPPPGLPGTSAACTIPVSSQVLPSVVPISSSGAANLQTLGSPLATAQPAWSASVASAVPALAGPTPPQAPSVGAASRPAGGSAPQQKPRAPPPGCSAGTFPTPGRTATLGTSIRPDAGSTAAGFSLQAGSAALGAVALVPHHGAGGSVFGSSAPRPFAFGGLETPMDCAESGPGGRTAQDLSSGAQAGAFIVGPVPPSGTTGLVTPVAGGWSHNIPGPGNQGSAFASGRAAFGGLVIAPFAPNPTGPGPAQLGTRFGAGVPRPPTQGAQGRGPFRSAAPSFSIGAKFKTPRSREQGHSRRHHGHKR